MNEDELVQVGDTIVTKTCLGGVYSYLVTRVTKTLAISKRESDGHEYKFKRLVGWDMSHPYEQWNTTKYEVIKGEQ